MCPRRQSLRSQNTALKVANAPKPPGTSPAIPPVMRPYPFALLFVFLALAFGSGRVFAAENKDAQFMAAKK